VEDATVSDLSTRIVPTVTVLVLVLATCASGCAREGPPNLIIILADDLGYGDTGVYGSEVITTPNIDALAARGVRFTDGYVAAAVCSPSRAALMTGRYPQRFGYHFNNNAGPGLPTTETTLASRLREVGYTTGIIGKWQLGMSADTRPMARGFDEFFGMASGTIYIEPGTPGVESFSPVPLPEKRQRPIYRGDTEVEVTDYITDVFTDEAVDFIERHHERPFFLYLAHYAPHVPLQATAKYLRRFAHVEDKPTRIFAAMVSAVDDSVGRVVAALREHGIDDNTLIVFLSDNGCAGYLQGACSNAPLNGGKRYHWDGGIRVPFLMSWPARVTAGTVSELPVSSLDISATMIAAATGSSDLPTELDGVDLMPFVAGKTAGTPHDRLFWRAGPNRAVREGRWKLWQVNRATEEMVSSIEVGGLLPRYRAPNGSPLGQLTLLYDLEKDIGERSNLAADKPEIVERLIGRLDEWNEDKKDPSVVSTRGTATTIDGVPVEIIF
jgi:arylsulfatase A-like enzyme